RLPVSSPPTTPQIPTRSPSRAAPTAVMAADPPSTRAAWVTVCITWSNLLSKSGSLTITSGLMSPKTSRSSSDIVLLVAQVGTHGVKRSVQVRGQKRTLSTHHLVEHLANLPDLSCR